MSRPGRIVLSVRYLTLSPDDPEIYDGAHVAIQLVGRRLQEEKVIALGEYLDGLLHG